MSHLATWRKSLSLAALLAPLAWATGPIFEKELCVAARRRRYFALRVAYLALLTGWALYAWVGAVGAMSWDPMMGRLITAAVGRSVVEQILILQIALLPVLVAIMLSGSVSDEVRSRTLSVLMVTPVGGLRIVLGKLLSRLLVVGLLMAVSLPLLVLLRIMGGVNLETVLAGLAVTATTCLFIGATSILLSTFLRTSVITFLITGAVLVALFVWHADAYPKSYGVARGWANAYAFMGPLVMNPYAVFRVANNLPAGSLYFCGLHIVGSLLVSALILLWAALRVRRVGLRQALGQDRSAARWEGFMRPKALSRRKESDPIRTVTGSPVLWRERQVHFGPSRFAALVAWTILAGGVGIVDFVGLYARGREAGGIFFGGCIMLFSMGIFITLIQAAPGLSAEKEGQTLPLLLSTPMPVGRIVYDKAVGAVRRMLPVWGLLAAHTLLFAVLGYAHPIVIFHLFLLAAGVILFFTGTGLFFAARVRRASTAVALNLGLAVALLVLPVVAAVWVPISPMARATANPLWVVIACHPVGQTWIVSLGSVFDIPDARLPKQTPALIYEWGWTMGNLGWPATTGLVLALSTAYGGMGLLYGARAGRRLRRGGA
jgi:ABC-type transport system involved in multi-copper enzyme maturation permease subunit